jgi:ATP-dependent helicase/nuclease subunit B
MNPLGYSEFKPENYEEKILLIDKARRAIITPLSNLADESREAVTVEDHATALVKFLVSLDVEEKLRLKSMETVQSKSTRSDLARLWKSLCGALEGMCEVIGTLQVSAETFLTLLKIAFSEIKIARIPAFCEQVVCGSADTARMQGKKYIYVIGVNSGVFPATVDDDDFFTEKDKSLLLGVGLSVSEGSKIKSARELYLFSRAISYARVGVNISYTAQDSAFKSISPSEAVTRIIEKSRKLIAPIKTAELSAAERVYTKEYALEHLSEARGEEAAIKEALIRSGFDERLKISESNLHVTNAKLSDDSLRMLYGSSVKTSSSKLEKYSSCPMSYFCSYNLGLNEEEKAEFNSMNIGTFIHAVLENFFKELKERGKRISEITAEEKADLIKRVSADFAAKLFDGIPKTSARVQNTVSVLSRQASPIIDSLCDEFANCEYTPVFFELSIDNTDAATPESPIFNTDTGHSLYLVGKVDRVDTYEKDGNVYVRVIDYKTGNKEFSPSDLEEGKNLQMFLYLKAITESKNAAFLDRLGNADKLIPAGVIYVKSGIADGAVKKNDPNAALDSVKKEQKRLGMILDDKDSISAMNDAFIPVKFKVTDGTPYASTKNRLYTEEGWKKISKTIDDAVKDIAERMTSGDISALSNHMRKGKNNPCEWCGFKAICRNPNLK